MKINGKLKITTINDLPNNSFFVILTKSYHMIIYFKVDNQKVFEVCFEKADTASKSIMNNFNTNLNLCEIKLLEIKFSNDIITKNIRTLRPSLNRDRIEERFFDQRILDFESIKDVNYQYFIDGDYCIYLKIKNVFFELLVEDSSFTFKERNLVDYDLKFPLLKIEPIEAAMEFVYE